MIGYLRRIHDYRDLDDEVAELRAGARCWAAGPAGSVQGGVWGVTVHCSLSVDHEERLAGTPGLTPRTPNIPTGSTRALHARG